MTSAEPGLPGHVLRLLKLRVAPFLARLTQRPSADSASYREPYERDYYSRIQEQVRFLASDVPGKSIANVAEEIEDLGKSEKHSVESQLARIVEHLTGLWYRLSKEIKSP